MIVSINRFLVLVALSLLASGCSPREEELPGYEKGSGDLGQFIVQRSAKLGVTAKQTNGVPAFTGQWRYKEDASGFQIYIAGDHFDQLHSILNATFGPPANPPSTNSVGGTTTISAAYGAELGGTLNYSYEKSLDGNQFTSLAFIKEKK